MSAHALPPPLPLSLLVCERVVIDAMTGQHNLIGILAHVQAFNFPVGLPQLAVYAEITNGRGPTALMIRIIDANEERPAVFEATVQVQIEDPLTLSQLVISLTNVVFPEPGEYRVQLVCGPEVLLERRLVLVPMNPQTTEPPEA